MKQDFKLNLQEIVRFLELVVIKFDHFETYFDLGSTFVNKSIAHAVPIDSGGTVSLITSDDKIDATIDEKYLVNLNYYRLLSGDDTLLQNEVLVFNPSYVEAEDKYLPLSKLLLETHTSIRPYYFGLDNKYLRLKDKYPDDFELIKRIFYPIDPLTAVQADNMDVLYTPEFFLKDNEREDMREHLQEIIKIIEYRWYINTWKSEDLYPLVFWGTLWGFLPVLLLLRRLDNLHTDKAHSFYVWEYLQSKGLPDLSTMVTQDQEHFLYKNIRYLQENFGKHFLLKELERVFLQPRKCHFAGKRLMNIVDGREEYTDRLPEVIDTIDGNPNYNDSISLDSFLNSITLTGYADPTQTPDQISETIGYSRRTEYQTKFLEIRSSGSSEDTRAIYNTIFDAFMKLYSDGHLHYNILVSDARFGTNIESISIHDIICLLNYLINYDQKDIIGIPQKYVISNAIINRDGSYPDYFGVNGFSYETDLYMDVNDIFTTLPPEVSVDITSPSQAAGFINEDIEWIADMKKLLKSKHELIDYRCVIGVLKHIVYARIQIDLPTAYSTYDEFFDNKEDLRLLILSLTDVVEREEMIETLFTTLLPVSFSESIDTTEIVSHIKHIFKSLTSYNVTLMSSIISEQLTLQNHTLGNVRVESEEGWIGLSDVMEHNTYSVSFAEETEMTLQVKGGLDSDFIEEEQTSELSIINDGSTVDMSAREEGSIYAYNTGSTLTLLDDLI